MARSVLLVEDNEAHAALFRELFLESRVEARLEHAENLRDAFEIAEERPPLAIILDLGLRETSGLETLEQVRSRLPQVPIVVLTATAERSLSIEAIREGAQDYLVKGEISSEVVGRSIRYACERSAIQAELERKTRDLDAFASMVSHDLQSPLRRVRQICEIVAEEMGAADGDLRFLLRELVGNTRRLQQLVTDLLRFARAGSRGLEIAEVPMGDALESALSGLADLVAEKDADIRWNQLPSVQADRSLLELVLQNLVSNALKYVSDVAPSVRITVERQGEEQVVRVSDNGIGIAPEALDRIFEPLERAVSNEVAEGSGLGLATCRKIVGAHGGRIWAESTPGSGSVFSLALPTRGDATG